MTRAAWLLLGFGCVCSGLHLTSGVAAAQEKTGRLGGLFAEPPRALGPTGPEPELVDIERKLDALAQRSDAGAAASAIERGRAALSDARAAFAAQHPDVGSRQKQIAWAALALAQQRIASADATRSAARARERERSAREEHARAEAALAQAQANLRALREQAAR